MGSATASVFGGRAVQRLTAPGAGVTVAAPTEGLVSPSAAAAYRTHGRDAHNKAPVATGQLTP
jgi:hypothetical protein